jgi:hypothetical protein
LRITPARGLSVLPFERANALCLLIEVEGTCPLPVTASGCGGRAQAGLRPLSLQATPASRSRRRHVHRVDDLAEQQLCDAQLKPVNVADGSRSVRRVKVATELMMSPAEFMQRMVVRGPRIVLPSTWFSPFNDRFAAPNRATCRTAAGRLQSSSSMNYSVAKSSCSSDGSSVLFPTGAIRQRRVRRVLQTETPERDARAWRLVFSGSRGCRP